jgi:hypothetical protein
MAIADAVVSVDALHFAVHPTTAAREALRLLPPGGPLALIKQFTWLFQVALNPGDRGDDIGLAPLQEERVETCRCQPVCGHCNPFRGQGSAADG